MIRINVFGDYCVNNQNGIQFSEEIYQILKDADFNALNFEGPIQIPHEQRIKKSGPHLCQDPSAPQFLQSAGFNVIMFANNHILDYGEFAAMATYKAFCKSLPLGLGDFQEAYKLGVVEKDGKKIAFLNLTQFEFGVLDDEITCNGKKGTAWLQHPSVSRIIVEAKKRFDYLIILPHAGLEHFECPLPELRTIYKNFLDLGADAVIGGHPHTPQGWEMYHNKPIVYSLGNFCFEAIDSNTPYWDKGLIAHLTLERKISLDIIPIQFDKKSRSVEIDSSAEIKTFLVTICDILQNENRYLHAVNDKCLALEYLYSKMIEYSGFYRPSIRKSYYHLCHNIKNKLLSHKDEYDMTHLINSIRNEPHRWVQSRIFELKYSK